MYQPTETVSDERRVVTQGIVIIDKWQPHFYAQWSRYSYIATMDIRGLKEYSRVRQL